MHREADVLQDRIEITPFDWGIGNAQEWIRGQQNEKIERGADPCLHRQHMGAQRQWQVISKRRDKAAEQREDQHPQQHGPFMVSPYACDLVDQRLQRMRVFINIHHREIRGDVKIGQGCE